MKSESVRQEIRAGAARDFVWRIGRFAAFGLMMLALAVACAGTSEAKTAGGAQPSPGQPSEAEKASYAAAVAYCRWNVPKPLALREDKRVLCFDGTIEVPSDFAAIDGLAQGGFFVVRSAGGDARVAVQLADILRGKQAVVIINDYCLANCANYLFIASFTTFVPKDSLVAWSFVKKPQTCIDLSGEHHEAPRFSPCNSSFHDGRRDEEIDQLKRKFSEGRARSPEPSRVEFLRDRPREDLDQLGPLFRLPPQSAAVRLALKDITDARGGRPGVYWTWNPRFYPSVITTKVFYEAYPKSQDEVDAIVKRIGLGTRVIYDP
jgi:hypothetical protein